MQKYKVTIIALGVFLTFIIAGYLLIQKNQNKSVSVSINAVPINASFIIEIQNISTFKTVINSDTSFLSELRLLSAFDNLNKYINYIDTLFEKNSKAKNIFEYKSLLISSHLLGKDKIENLFLINILGNTEKKKIQNIIEEIVGDTSSIIKKDFDSETIYQIKNIDEKNKDLSLYYCYLDNNFIFSFSDILIEKSILQVESHNPITLETSFKKVSETGSANSSVKFYINFGEINKILEPLVSNEVNDKINLLTNFADWSALDLYLKPNYIMASGLTYTAKTPEKYLAIFDNQTPVEVNVNEILPEYTSEFILFGISDNDLFYDNYKKYLASINKLDAHNLFFDKAIDTYKLFLDKIFLDIIAEVIIFAEVKFNFLKNDNSEFIICKVKNSAEKELWDVTEIYSKKDSTEQDAFKKVVELDNEETMDIYKFPFEDIFSKLFGEIYNIRSHDYYCFIDDYLIFSESGDNLIKFANAFNSGEIFANNAEFQNFIKLTLEKSNLFYFNNASLNNSEYKNVLNDDLSVLYKKNSELFSKITALGIQFSFSEDVFYTDICFSFKDNQTQEATINWGVEIDSSVTVKPQIVINHNTNQKEIFIQDKKNNIYLITNEGEILWKKNIGEKIISEITQIDYFKNNKFQILFSTKSKIYLIDRNGENVEKYPVTFKSSATAGISVFDYDKNKTYRIFVPCSNNKVYLYDIDGTINDGWVFDKTDDIVYTPVQFFRDNDKDYIIFADKLQTYILNRKGEKRIVITTNFPKSQNNEFFYFPKTETSGACFVTTNSSGAVETIYLDGSITETKLKEFTYNHYFTCIDLNNDSKPDYIFADNNTMEIYDNSGELISSYLFSNEIELPISIYKFSADNVKIGISDKKSSKIYLFNSDGSIFSNFPVNGNYLFSIGVLKGEKFSLITSYKENTLYNYQIE